MEHLAHWSGVSDSGKGGRQLPDGSSLSMGCPALLFKAGLLDAKQGPTRTVLTAIS